MTLGPMIAASQVLDEWQPDTLLIVWQDAETDLAAPLEGKINPGLSWTDSGLQVEIGFYGPKGRQPFARLKWQEDSLAPTGLEQRYVGHRALHKLANTVAFTEVIWADGDTPALRAIGEDFYAASFDPLYLESRLSKWQFVSHKKSTTSAQAARTRLSYQLSYRQWMNENPDEMTSKAIGKRLKAFAKKHNLDIDILEKKELEEQNMNLLLAVGQASKLSPSRLIVVKHRPKGSAKGGGASKSSGGIALVGKGITFDTGGINVKSHESHVNCMKNDMGGAALMANLFMALVASGYDQPLTLVIPSCENLVGKKAMKPGSVLTSRSGKRVIIEHTDCEGRLILADALDYTHTEVAPKLTLVAATLTTASMRQFSNFFTPVYFADAAWRRRLDISAAAHGENFIYWDNFLPFTEANHSPFGLTNLGIMPGPFPRAAGSNVAAHFLKQFYPGELIHFDIFASGWNWSGTYPGAHYGATGAVFNTLFSALLLSQHKD